MRKDNAFVPAVRRRLVRTAAVVTMTAFLASVFGCSSETLARRSLRKVGHREINQFNKYHQREVRPKVYISGMQFYRIYHERVDPKMNMRRTKSADIPFVATISFTENIYLTPRRDNGEDSKTDSHFVLSKSKKREIVYTFVDGSWRRKEIY